MIQIDEGQLDGYLTTWLNNKYPHLLNPWFQAKVVSVTSSSPPFTVTIQKLGEPSSDGAEYVVAPSGYCPQVGDQVECCWRDNNSAYVMWPLSQNAMIPAEVVLQRSAIRAGTTLRVPATGILPQHFEDYRIIVRGVGDGAAGRTFTDIYLTFNNDTGANTYTQGWLYVSGTTPVGSSIMNAGGPQPIAQLPGTSQNMGHAIIDIPFATAPQVRAGRSAYGWSTHIEGYGNTNNIANLIRNVWWWRPDPIRTILMTFSGPFTGDVRVYGR